MEDQRISHPDQPDGESPSPASAGGDSKEQSSNRVVTEFKPGTGRMLGIIALPVTLLLLGGFFAVHQHRHNHDAMLAREAAQTDSAGPSVEVVPVKYAGMTEPLTMPGSTSGWYESTIYARVSGYVATWTADIGDHVKSGDVLATIDTPDLDAKLAAAQARLAAAEADVNVAESNVALAKTTYDRWWNSPEGVVSQQERDEKQAEFKSSVSKLKAAQAQVKISQADVTSLTAFTAYKNVTAPFDGIVTARKIDIGDLVSAGSTTGITYLYSVAQSDRIRVFIDVPQAASAMLKAGMSAAITAGEYPDRTFAGRVCRTSNSIDSASRTLRVEVDIDNKDFALVPGMYVQVTFDLPQKPLPQVPASALLFRATGLQIAIIGDDHKVHFHKVTIANDLGDVVEIGSGVPPHAKVALNLSSQIADGDRVTPRDDSPSDDARLGRDSVSSAGK